MANIQYFGINKQNEEIFKMELSKMKIEGYVRKWVRLNKRPVLGEQGWKSPTGILKGKGLNANNRNDPQVIKDYIVIGMKIDREELLTKIKKRLTKRFDEGMIAEVESLLADGLSKERLKYFGLEYKIIGEYLLNNLGFNLAEMDCVFFQILICVLRLSERLMLNFLSRIQ